MLWASFCWFKNGISYTMNLGASPQFGRFGVMEYWNVEDPAYRGWELRIEGFRREE